MNTPAINEDKTICFHKVKQIGASRAYDTIAGVSAMAHHCALEHSESVILAWSYPHIKIASEYHDNVFIFTI